MSNDSTHPLRVCLIEDNTPLREEMVFGLGLLGFTTTGFDSAEAFYRGLVDQRFDLAVIDIGLPGEDGLSLARRLRTSGGVGIVILSGHGQLDDRLRGLTSADFYLVKPVDLRELAAVLLNLGRRIVLENEHSPSTTSRRDTVMASRWQLRDNDWTLVAPSGECVPLTASERIFLHALVAANGTPVSPDTLAIALGKNPYEFDTHRLQVLVSRLRKKTTVLGLTLPVLPVRGTGYRFQNAPI